MRRYVLLGAAVAGVALAGCGKIGSVAVKAVAREGGEAGAKVAGKAAVGGAKAGAKAGEGSVGGRVGGEVSQQAVQVGAGQLTGDGSDGNKRRR